LQALGTLHEQHFDQLAEALALADVLGEPAELHGQLCGLACTMGVDAAGPAWVMDLLADSAVGGSGLELARDRLATAANETLGSLQSGDMSLKLGIPEDNAPLSERAEALAHWCQGFLHGLGVGASPDRYTQAESAAEIISDFSEISRAAFEPGDDEGDEDSEAAYAELVEYVRVSAQLAFEELRAWREQTAGGEPH
jgi:uncharacterized protein YgfB (UPF0149 family)